MYIFLYSSLFSLICFCLFLSSLKGVTSPWNVRRVYGAGKQKLLGELRLTASSSHCLFVSLPLRLTASSSHRLFVSLPLRLTASSSHCLFVSLPLRLTVSSSHCLFVSRSLVSLSLASRSLSYLFHGLTVFVVVFGSVSVSLSVHISVDAFALTLFLPYLCRAYDLKVKQKTAIAILCHSSLA
jgi:hypothetical protein